MPDHYTQARAAGGTVLIVVGDDDVRSLIRITLARRGYRVLEGHDAEAGFDVAARHEGSIDLLITHVAVSGMRAPDFAQQMREFHNNLRVLFVSELACDAKVLRSLRSQATDLIRRPFSLRDMADRVGALMSTATY